ncbi:MAG: DinB family protein [Armatimonadetes bacterium]|nr:DinB family protein [Armatimonadota bacterium]
MTAQEFICQCNIVSMEGIIKQAKKMPEDKLTWEPMGEGRTALDQVAECALICGFIPDVLAKREMPNIDEAAMAEFEKSKQAYKNLADVEADLRSGTEKLNETIMNMTNDELDIKIPFFGGEEWSLASIANLHGWNMQYHTGQICYIQTLYGDKDMN